jgi:preprotein translocase subunit SecD
MSKRLRWKWFLIILILLACIAGVIHFPKSKKELVANWNRNIRLGLDLKGGSHIVMQIQVQDAFKVEADRAIERLKKAMDQAGIPHGAIERNEPDSVESAEDVQIVIQGFPSDRASELRRIVADTLGRAWIFLPDTGASLRLGIAREQAVILRQDTLIQCVNTIQRKIDNLGIAETSVQQRGGAGSNEILIQLPGVDDPTRVKGILQTAAMLEFCPVIDGPYPSEAVARAAQGVALPENSKLMRGPSETDIGEVWWLVSRSPIITGGDLRDARAEPGEFPGRWDTGFQLSPDAAQRFAGFTEAHINKRLAIVVDNTVLSAPRIDNRIADQGRIQGARTLEEAQDLALNLRAGSLPAGVKVIEERTVGPSLGADSIHRGIIAGIVSLALVVTSMVLYYRGAGLNAVSALMLNAIITIAALSYLEATWTLPGIAGLVLSIGMAVDSNVLIFERIKEELNSGKRMVPAIANGFDRALLTIIDTHVTTVVASAFLFAFGTGPVRGFAVTLVIGLVANLFTAVFVSRAIFDYQLWRHPKLPSLSIGSRKDLFQKCRIGFMNRRILTLGISVLAMILSLAGIAGCGLKPGLDFRGGALVQVKFAGSPAIDDLREMLSSHLEGEISVQDAGGGGSFLVGANLAAEKDVTATRERIEQVLRDKYGISGGKLDLNTTNESMLHERLKASLPGHGIMMAEEDLNNLAASILNFRDRVNRGLLRDINQLNSLAGLSPDVLKALKAECGTGKFHVLSADIVGPRAGAEMRSQALMATFGALGGMLIYIAFRFKWISGVAAIVATVHDVVITLGLFAWTGREINLNIVAALLTLIGYSMNDKIVVFDRVRENLKMRRPGGSFLQLVNDSIHQTLSRTLLTAGPTLLACLALYFLGGEVLNGIAFALFSGIVVGTYSSIFVASALLVIWKEHALRSEGVARQEI